MSQLDFAGTFEKLTGYPPFPWQQALYARFAEGDIPDACTLPTGLGKTSVIAVWLIALANGKPVPRRLVYVVNRRTVVDQTTDEAVKYRKNAEAASVPPPAISTLRGQFADNREWSADPSRPAIICGTVDMIGSRLLFSGYGIGFKSRPLHAGFLGQDVLLVHDEAHLEPAFQDLLCAIRDEQKRCKDFCPLHVMELTATSRSGGAVFPNEEEWAVNEADETVKRRIGARKQIGFFGVEDEKSALVKKVIAQAKERSAGNAAVTVFVRSVEQAGEIAKQLDKAFPGLVEQLNGTLRGYERDKLVEKAVFQRFLSHANRAFEHPAFLVCTSAGEVGVNISADHLVCDLSTFDSMAQRFGRVNRFGEPLDHVARIDIVYLEFDKDEKLNDLDRRRKRTLELLRRLDGDGSPRALCDVHRAALHEGSGTGPTSTDHTKALRDYILSTYAPQPTTLITSDILFDAWALTTIRDKLPGRPPVAEYLHGLEDDKQRETHVAWREEVSRFAGTMITAKQIGDLLDEFPLRPHELLRDATYRVQDELAALVEYHEKATVWVIDPDDTVHLRRLGRIAEKDNKNRYVENLAGRTVVLAPSVGGLTKNGMLSGNEPHDPERDYDVAGLVRLLPSGSPLVRLVMTPDEGDWTYDFLAPILDPSPEIPFQLDGETERDRLREVFSASPMRVAYRLDLFREEAEQHDEYLVLKPESPEKVYHHQAAWPALDAHNLGVEGFARSICERLRISDEITRAVSLAAKWHDLGKGRSVWQRGAGNTRGAKPVAKPLHGRPPENLNHYRHELGSIIDVLGDPGLAKEFGEQKEWGQDLTLHLIAAHHGRARPHFPDAEADDPERPAISSASVAVDTPGRFARLQRRYGRWGLAYLESLIRAADALDSKRIEETPIGDEEPGSWPAVSDRFVWPAGRAALEPTIRVDVDPTNPGQFFACCGMLELGDRRWPGTTGWFAGPAFCMLCGGSLAELVQQLAHSEIRSSLSDPQLKRLGTLLSVAKATLTPADLEEKQRLSEMWKRERLHLSTPFNLWLDWWRDERGERTELKTWAAKQLVAGMARDMLRAIREADWAKTPQPNQLFRLVRADFLPFYFDSDLSGQGAARDAGWSADALELKSDFRPLLELMAFIGLQRFRPAFTSDDRMKFCLWSTPLPPSVAAVAATGAFGSQRGSQYEFSLFDRTKYMKAFLPAQSRQGVFSAPTSSLPTGEHS